MQKNILIFLNAPFCGFCVTFASSASLNPS
jgi:hypothetical protein